MNTATWLSLHDELEKIASHAAELAGLGILAAPSIQHLRGKEMSEKNKARTEVAGLGVLAAPSALAAGKAGLSKGKALLRARRVAGFASKVAGVGTLGGSALKTFKASAGSNKLLGRAAGVAGAGALGYAAHKIYKHLSGQTQTKTSAVSSSQMKKMYQLSSRASGPIAQAVEGTAKLRSSPSNLSRAVHIAGQTASGGHAWNPATAAKRAISL